jgi:phosphatidylethanolamine-binding protein (PEBP) family uncharacterized protein
MRRLIIGTVVALAVGLSGPAVAAFELTSFDWGNIKLCTSGDPNSVTNPTFVLKDVPAGTTKLKFRMTDRDVPGYNHGGGTVSDAGGTTVKPGAFKYKSPCPPNGSHNYQWTVMALDGTGKTVGSAKASKRYP